MTNNFVCLACVCILLPVWAEAGPSETTVCRGRYTDHWTVAVRELALELLVVGCCVMAAPLTTSRGMGPPLSFCGRVSCPSFSLHAPCCVRRFPSLLRRFDGTRSPQARSSI
uniref:Putative secreted protein n=1 Tax=Ixodes ricinus TaxID=34613 RepID=A0A6B0UJR4_IXORI